jgi:hypothetical protein
LLRQYFPKGTDLSMHSANDLEAVALALNTRPRKSLGGGGGAAARGGGGLGGIRWRTPAEALTEVLRSAKRGRVATTS